jgi:hypothetical protein
MNVTALQQYLRSLVAPLTAAGAGPQADGLERACRGLEPYRDRTVGAFADLLARADAYEREGKLPAAGPVLAGVLVDEPTARHLADRLRTLLDREVPAGAPLPAGVRAELDKLAKLKPARVQELARELGAEESFRTSRQGVEKIVLKLTGQGLTAKGGSRRRPAAAADPAEVQRLVEELRATPADQLDSKLTRLEQSLTQAAIKALAAALGAAGSIRSKAQGLAKVRERLQAAGGAATQQPGAAPPATPGTDTDKLVEVLTALKAKAERPGAPAEEIEDELRSLGGRLDRDTAIAVARRLGVVRSLDTRAEALEAIRRKVFEVKLARESIAY